MIITYINTLGENLNDYLDVNASNYFRIYKGFTMGSRLNYTGPRVHVTANNLTSAVEHHVSFLDKVNKEIILVRIMGPFHQLPIANLHLSPVGLVENQMGDGV